MKTKSKKVKSLGFTLWSKRTKNSYGAVAWKNLGSIEQDWYQREAELLKQINRLKQVTRIKWEAAKVAQKWKHADYILVSKTDGTFKLYEEGFIHLDAPLFPNGTKFALISTPTKR